MIDNETESGEKAENDFDSSESVQGTDGDETGFGEGRSAFNRVQRIILLPIPNNYSGSADGRSLSHNPRNNNRTLPLVERIPGIFQQEQEREREREPEELPEAYPVNTHAHVRILRETTSEREYPLDPDETILMREYCINFIYAIFMVGLLSFAAVIIVYSINEPEESSNSSNLDNGTILPDNYTLSTLAPSDERLNSTLDSDSTFKCFLDPWEIYIHEEVAFRGGVDPSIPRTYHICPNSHLKIKYYDHQLERFDENSGEYYSFILFRPNVSVKCGFDGSYENNCTLSGGTHHIILISVAVFDFHKILDIGPENITFEGFRFTGAYRGVNSLNHAVNQSLTLKNCVFDHNYEMLSTIYLTPTKEMEKSTLNLQNCTFEHNTYRFYRKYGSRPNVGVIASYVSTNNDAIINTHISNTIFRNNTFLLEDEPETLPSLINEDFTPEGVHVNGAIINLVSATGVLDITDSCFVGNKGYTDSLIIMDKDNRTVLQSSYGNYFTGNEPGESDELSCILLYQNVSYMNGYIMEILNKEELSCSDHFLDLENDEKRGNTSMCSVRVEL